MSSSVSQNNSGKTLVQMDPFLLKALQDPRDRIVVLQLDKQLEKLMKNPRQNQLEFPSMNGYQRMMVHKVAHYFGMMHTYDKAKRSVTVFKQEGSGIPVLRFGDLAEQPDDKLRKVVLLKRPQSNKKSNDCEVKEDEDTEGQSFSIQSKHKIVTREKSPIDTRIKSKKENTSPTTTIITTTPSTLPTVIASRPKTQLTSTPTILTKSTVNQLAAYSSNRDSKTTSTTTNSKSMEEREEAYLKARARIFADTDESKLKEWSSDMDNPVETSETDDDLYGLNEESKSNSDLANFTDRDSEYLRLPLHVPSDISIHSSTYDKLSELSYPTGRQVIPVNDIQEYIPYDQQWPNYGTNYPLQHSHMLPNRVTYGTQNKYNVPMHNAQTQYQPPKVHPYSAPNLSSNPPQHDFIPHVSKSAPHFTDVNPSLPFSPYPSLHYMNMSGATPNDTNYRSSLSSNHNAIVPPSNNLDSSVSSNVRSALWATNSQLQNNTLLPHLPSQIKSRPYDMSLPHISQVPYSQTSNTTQNDDTQGDMHTMSRQAQSSERQGINSLYSNRPMMQAPSNYGYNYFPSMNYDLYPSWEYDENERYTEDVDDLKSTEIIQEVFSGPNEFLNSIDTHGRIGDNHQRVSILPAFSNHALHVPESGYEDMKNLPIGNSSISLYGSSQRLSKLPSQVPMQTHHDNFSHVQSNTQSANYVSSPMYIPQHYYLHQQHQQQHNIYVNPVNKDLGWVTTTTTSILPLDPATQVVPNNAQGTQKQIKQKRGQKQRQKQKQKKKVASPTQGLMPTLVTKLSDIQISNNDWDEQQSEPSSEEKSYISNTLLLNSESELVVAAQPSHILEVEVISPQKRDAILEQLKQKGGIVKLIESTNTTIAIFRTKAIAKEVLDSVAGSDFCLKPFTVLMGTGFESFTSNRNPKLVSNIGQIEKTISEPEQEANIPKIQQPVELLLPAPFLNQPNNSPVFINGAKSKTTTTTTTITTTTTTTIITTELSPQGTTPKSHVPANNTIDSQLKTELPEDHEETENQKQDCLEDNSKIQ